MPFWEHQKVAITFRITTITDIFYFTTKNVYFILNKQVQIALIFRNSKIGTKTFTGGRAERHARARTYL
jgi:hypothetical protein